MPNRRTTGCSASTSGKSFPPPLTRIVDSVPLHGPAGIIHELSVSAAVNLAICRVFARDRTLPCHLNQRDGTSNPTTGLLVTATAVRETLNRSGHHPHRSIRTSSGSTVISHITSTSSTQTKEIDIITTHPQSNTCT